jgi:hypothetical protein
LRWRGCRRRGSPGGRAGAAIAACAPSDGPARGAAGVPRPAAVTSTRLGESPCRRSPSAQAACRCSLSTSAGVLQSSVLRGRVLRAAATAARSSVLCQARSVPFGNPEIELADLARPVDRALVRARLDEQRTHLAQVVVDDRLGALEAERLDQLTHPDPGQLRVPIEQRVDLTLERIELRGPSRPSVARRLISPQRAPDGVAIDPVAPRQLLDRHPANEVLPAQLGPPLHVQHAPSPGLDRSRPSQAHQPRGRPRPRPQRGAFSTGGGGEFSTGADTEHHPRRNDPKIEPLSP